MNYPSFDLTGKVALVTGGGRGIGLATVRTLSKAGAAVVIAGPPDTGVEAAVAQVQSDGGRAWGCELDVTVAASVEAAVAGAVRELGQLDIMVNNAGISLRKPALEETEEEFDRMQDVNLKGVYLGAKAAGRHMIERRQGKLVNLASIFGLAGYPNRLAYCVSKGGVANLTRALATEWAPYNVQVNAVAPGFVDSPMTEQFFSIPAIRKELTDRTPAGRLGRLEDIAGAIWYLASPAADWVNGHVLAVDGGYSAW